MASDYIKIRGARVHNLQNISVDIPRDKLAVFTGLSGSGKSSLASTPSTPKGTGGSSNRSRPTPGNFSVSSTNPTSI